MTSPEAREAHPFERGGPLSTTCARSDCWQAPMARIHQMPAQEGHASTCRYPDLPREKCGCLGPSLTPAAPEERGEGLDADLNADERAELELLRRNKDEDTPGPWIQRAFDALGTAKANARRIEELEAAATPAPDTGAEERPSELAAAAWLVARGGAEERQRAAHPDEPHDFRTTCLRCGESGFLHVALITDDEVVRIEPRSVLSGGSVDEEGPRA